LQTKSFRRQIPFKIISYKIPDNYIITWSAKTNWLALINLINSSIDHIILKNNEKKKKTNTHYRTLTVW
jgi:hypothetical protein